MTDELFPSVTTPRFESEPGITLHARSGGSGPPLLMLHLMYRLVNKRFSILAHDCGARVAHLAGLAINNGHPPARTRTGLVPRRM